MPRDSLLVRHVDVSNPELAFVENKKFALLEE
jgi:hypothetical protein